jgi:hypothetical protein
MTANRKNITQNTTMMIWGIVVLGWFVIKGIQLSFFWSLGETEKYIAWLMPGEFTWALAWFVQVGGDSFHLIAHTVASTRRWLAWLLHVAAIIFNIADGGTNHGSLQASPLEFFAGRSPEVAARVEMVIAYGTAFLEQLVVLSLLALLVYWRLVTIDFGWPEWTRPAWLVGSSTPAWAKAERPEQQRPSTNQRPIPASQSNMQPVRVSANGGNTQRTRQRPPQSSHRGGR